MASSAIQSLKGMVALVTGGASGLGRATAERLSREGAKVLIADLSSSDGVNVAKSMSNAVFHPTDVSQEIDAEDCVQACKDNFGRLDLLVNAAGVGIAFRVYNFKKKRAHSLDEFERVIRVNLLGTFNMTRLAVGLIGTNQPDADGQRGVVVNTASIAAFEGQTGQSAYAASKGGIVGMTLPLARDLCTHGIRVNAIAPGLFDTPLLNSLPESVRKFLCDAVPFPPRLGNPEEFAHTVQWIFENPYVNGTVVRLDGALRMQS